MMAVRTPSPIPSAIAIRISRGSRKVAIAWLLPEASDRHAMAAQADRLETSASATPTEPVRLNAEIAARLEEVAQVLADQEANPYRVNAYRQAAHTVRDWPVPVAELAQQQGIAGLATLPGIGVRLAQAIYQLVSTGRLPMLERLRGDSDPVQLLGSVVGIGRGTAERIHRELGIHTLEELEMAAHDGRLERLGLGPKRLAGIRDSLASRLGRIGRHLAGGSTPAPGVEELLEVDREYRQRAEQGSLPRIAPRRFNPSHEAWLPIMHTRRGERHYTALFSNTAHAHERHRTHDWVVLYFDGQDGERQCTVITAERGALRGHRIVRGREAECLQHYGLAKAARSAR